MDVRVTGRGGNKNHVFWKYLENYSISIVFLDFFFVLEKARVVGISGALFSFSPQGPWAPRAPGTPGAPRLRGPWGLRILRAVERLKGPPCAIMKTISLSCKYFAAG